MNKPRLLVLSHVLPFPGESGQQQRVAYTLRACRPRFHVTFATAVRPEAEDHIREELQHWCDRVELLPSFHGGCFTQRWHSAAGALYALATGLKSSNYAIGRRMFSEPAIRKLSAGPFDCVLFEYWHAADRAALFQSQGIPCVLDTHNVLWRAYEADLKRERIPNCWRKHRLEQYRRREEESWRKFDALVAINSAELDHMRDSHPGGRYFYAPMGVDLDRWPYSWNPTRPARLAYYGGLGSAHNQESAWKCYADLMPSIWKHSPGTELWLIGSHPPERLRALACDPRIKVTGFVPDVKPLLSTMTAVLCPWKGTYGFRSRLVEVMALGTPVVATPDANLR
jgi:glycosyltransferase involved in cell wall biosynthesis